MPIYIKADDEVLNLLAETVGRYHKHLAEADVRFGAVMALAKENAEGEPVGPALTHHGVAALAKVRIVSHKDRVQGMPDAEIAVDGDKWADMPEEERSALLDHELTHVKLVLDEDGKIKTDDGGRPRLRMRQHDYQFGWFTEVAQRHGKYSHEVQQAAVIMDENGQVYFPFLDDATPRPARPTADAAVGRFVDSHSATIRTDDGAGK